MWVIGMTFEIIADYQKFRFRSVPENKEKFIQHGLWKYICVKPIKKFLYNYILNIYILYIYRFSRHPNYFGEIVLVRYKFTSFKSK